MRVVIAGGYGAFGALTARLLLRDGHDVWLAGRTRAKAERVSRRIGARLLVADHCRDPEALFQPRPQVVIDAAGPFQAYRDDDPYALARAAIRHGCHYLDLSDASAFTRGIGALDAAARAAGVFVLSGASSVPGLSSTIARDLSRGLERIERIETAILPGNRAPRGMSVVRSIVGGVGRPVQVWRDGHWNSIRGWTARKRYRLAPELVRDGYLLDVPDLALFPAAFGARTVLFRAGLELPLMNRALSFLAALRRWWDLDLPRPAIAALYQMSRALYPFGTDRGSMRVSVNGSQRGQAIRRDWTLIAEKGEGPYVPGVLCRALLRQSGRVRAGARPCLFEVSRRDVERAMSDLAIETSERTAISPAQQSSEDACRSQEDCASASTVAQTARIALPSLSMQSAVVPPEVIDRRST